MKLEERVMEERYVGEAMDLDIGSETPEEGGRE